MFSAFKNVSNLDIVQLFFDVKLAVFRDKPRLEPHFDVKWAVVL